MATDEESNNPDTVRRGDVAPAFTIRLLGTFELCQAGQPLAPPRFRKSQSVLALLAIRRGCEVERDWLAGLLWPAASQPAALHNLRNSLADLRRALGPEAARLRSPTFRTLALDLNGAFVDVLAFDAALARGDPPGLEEAIALYQGPLLEGCAEDWAFQERQAREQAYFAARETLAAHSLARGDLADAEHHLRAVVATDPLRESAQRTLMELLAAGGNVAAALLAYRELRVRLHRDLNAEPDPETRALFERIRAEAAERANARRPTSDAHKALDEAASAAVPARLSGGGRRTSAVPRGRAPRRKSPGHAWGPAASAPIGDAHAASPAGPEETAAWPPDHLPRRLTRFFGREAEIERLGAMLQACGTALVTLTGPGGSGKTRLALETARRLQAAVAREAAPSCSSPYGQSPPECWFVPLLDLADPGLIADKIGDEMRLPRRPHEEPLERIVAFLSEHDPLRRRLLVLDNFEHLVEGGAEVVRTLLERVAGLTILVTSRRRLDLPGEREFPLTPLPVPRDEGRGMRDEIRGEERGMRDENRSGLLSSLIPHPSSLLACPSVALFVDRAQAVRPDFQVTAENAAAVAGLCRRLEGLPLAIELAAARIGVLTPREMLDRLQQRFELLAGRQRSPNPRHQSLRSTLDWSYQLLAPELQRFFARLSIFRGGWTLEAAAAVCETGSPAATRAFNPADRTDRTDPSDRSEASGLAVPGQDALACLEELHRCSLVVAEPAGEQMRYRLLETLREYAAEQLTAGEQTELAQRHLDFYRDRMQRGLPGIRGRTSQEKLDEIEREQDNLRAALDRWVESGAPLDWLMQPEEPHWGLLRVLAWFWSVRGSASEGRRRLAQILARPSAAAATLSRAYLLSAAGRLALQQGDFAAAEALLQVSRAIYQERGGKAGEQWCCQVLAHAARDQGVYARARAFHEQHLALARATGNEREVASALYGLGHTAYLEGDLATALPLLEEALRILRQGRELAWARAHPEDGGGDPEDYRAGAVHMDELAWACAHRGEAADASGDHTVAHAYLEESLALFSELGHRRPAAAVHHKLGRLSLHQGQWSAAAAHFCESLAFWQQEGNQPGIAGCLEGLGAVAAGRKQPERAARLLGAAVALRENCRVPVPPIERADLERVLAAGRACLGESALAATLAAGQALPLEHAIAEALQAAAAV